MRTNTRFPVAVHILALAVLAKKRVLTSEFLAGSVNTNPVVIRRTLAMLKKANLVNVKRGVGGIALLREPEQMTLLDIYNAVKNSEDDVLFNLHQNTNPKCYVGYHIHDALTPPLAQAQKAMEDKLAAYTLMDIVVPIAQKARIK